MSWKQPIPTNLKEMFGNDYLGMSLYVWLLINSANRDGIFMDQRGKSISVKRGQTIFGRNEYAKYLNCSPKTAERTLSRICLNVVLKLTKQSNKNFTVVSINNYDEVTSMTQQRPSNDQAMTTSKSVKSVKKRNIKEKKVSVFDVDQAKNTAELVELINWFNEKQNTAFKTEGILLNRHIPNFTYWREGYSLAEMKKAVSNIKHHPYWSTQPLDISWLLARKTKVGDVDRFEELLGVTREKNEPQKMQKEDINNYL